MFSQLETGNQNLALGFNNSMLFSSPSLHLIWLSLLLLNTPDNPLNSDLILKSSTQLVVTLTVKIQTGRILLEVLMQLET